MAIELVDLAMLQLAQQATLYNLTSMERRKRSANQLVTFYLQLLQDLKVTHTLEVGAHEAEFSIRAREKLGDQAVCRAFEANPDVYAYFLLEGRLRKLGIDYRHLAIGDHDGLVKFHVYETINGERESGAGKRHSCLERLNAQEDRHYALNIPMGRLDQLCAADAPDSRYALWIDAEGYGLRVLAGAAGILENTAAIYMELESEPKFAGQAVDREIFQHLMERDFLPLARDFQFPRQYNAVFVKRAQLPEAEPLWHRFFQKELRRELAFSFRLVDHTAPPKSQVMTPPQKNRVQEAGKLHYDNVSQLREAVMALQPIREAKTGLDPLKTVVACHAADLAAARKYYDSPLTQFYIPNLGAIRNRNNCHPIAELAPGMDVRLFCRQIQRPADIDLNELCSKLYRLGIANFSIERWSEEKIYRFGRQRKMTGAEWETALAFTNLLEDSASQYTYMAALRANLEGNPGFIPIAGYHEYQHPLVHAQPLDIICEGGCYPDYILGEKIISSTLKLYRDMDGQGQIFCFEPLPKICDLLKTAYQKYPGINVIEKALWSESGKLCLNENGAGSFMTAAKEDTPSCQCVSVDDFFADRQGPTLIKLDVEGAELPVLEGAIETLRQNRPKLMLSIYHARQGKDWLRLPEFLLKAGLPYKYFCGHHSFWFNETIVYAERI